MSIKEQSQLSDHFDMSGTKEGDRILVDPLMGRKYEIPIQRTSIDFISPNLDKRLNPIYKKVLGGQRGETFHVRIKLVETQGRNNAKKMRYMAEVLKGGPICLNGCYVLKCYLEENDSIEIGFNRIKLKRQSQTQGFDTQEQLISENLKVVKSTLSILINGETGVGKTSLAEKIHKNSKRNGRFVHLNISSFSESLVESEIFGHIKGAFTGATNDKRGAFREANKGTLFIDEIDSLPIGIQIKLLTFLDSQKARAVGETKEYEVDVRLIFSSGSDLKSLVKRGLMRKDFYFRISSGHQFKLSSLRDDPILIENFCNWFMVNNNIIISKKLIDFYQSLPWPGNYRQLKGQLSRKLVLSNSWKLDFDDSDELLIEQSSELIGLKEIRNLSTLEEIKVAYAKKVFFQFGQNYTQAAIKLSISTRSLRNMLKI